MYDLVLRDVHVVDGTGAQPFRADVGVDGGRIAAVGDLSGSRGRRSLAGAGRMLAPGFIDLHTHADFTLPLAPRAESMVRQGVTTIVVGNCGFSPYPVAPEHLDLLRDYVAFFDAGLTWEWEDLAGYAAALARLPLACDVVPLVGHGSVRIAVMGFADRDPSDTELDRMKRLVAEACEAGAFGVSTGLVYVPGSYARERELVALAEVAGRYGGFYASHIRNEAAGLLDAVAEALRIGRQARVPVQLSHHKAMGRRNWGRVHESLRAIDDARAAREDVLADQYPYAAGSTTLTSILPAWALEGGIEALLARLADPATRAAIRSEIAGHSDFDPTAIVVASAPPELAAAAEGRTLAELGEDPVEAALALLEAARGAVQIVAFGMSEDDVRTVMQHPAVAVASDGWTLNPDAGGRPHPRSYGTYARVLGTYVREQGVLSLEEAVRKMTSVPAQRLGRADLGRVAAGCRANVVLFDPDRVADRATFDAPHRYADGVTHVLVDGQLVIEEGDDTGAAAGEVLSPR